MAAVAAPEEDAGFEPTAANEFDGELRAGEPASRQARRNADSEIATWVMPIGERRHPRIASQPGKSASIGTVTAGYLADAVEMPVEATHVRVLDKAVPRNTRFTSAEMAQVLQCAADAVATEMPDRVMQLGNLSRKTGGPLPWSVSHHNGRDADVAFYALTADGKPAKMAHLYHFDHRGKSTDAPEPLTYDVAANWLLLKHLVLCADGELQYLFIADWLSYPAMAYALKHKEDKKIMAKVAAMTHQPKKAMPHNDHVHVRIGCASADMAEGCVDASRAPPSAVGKGKAVRERFAAIRAELKSADPQRRADAVYLLTLYRDADAYPEVARALRDPAAVVRRQAAMAVGEWDRDDAGELLAAALRSEEIAEVAAQIMVQLGQLRDTAALVAVMGDNRALVPSGRDVGTPVVQIRKVAVQLLADAPTLGAAKASVALLADSDPSVRDAARRLLERATNRVTTDLLEGAGAQLALVPAGRPLEPADERALWAAFFQALPADADLADVVRSGFEQHGLDVSGAGRKSLPALVQALAMPPPWRDNAALWIERALQYRPAVGKGAHANPQGFWSQFLVQRHILGSGEVQARMAAAMFGPAAAEPAASAGPAIGNAGSAPSADVD